MKFIADEGVDLLIVEAIRAQGHDVFFVMEGMSGASDEAIQARARAENRILITKDKDFGELTFRLKLTHAGIVLSRLEGLKGVLKAKIVAAVIEKYGDALAEAFTVIQPGNVRIRKY
jgi:predicted nuclease of predicted toxin-antitoxin system